jgi:hypothetical protein
MLKCVVSLIPAEYRTAQFPAVYHFSVLQMREKLKPAQFSDNVSNSRTLFKVPNML